MAQFSPLDVLEKKILLQRMLVVGCGDASLLGERSWTLFIGRMVELNKDNPKIKQKSGISLHHDDKNPKDVVRVKYKMMSMCKSNLTCCFPSIQSDWAWAILAKDVYKL